MSVAMIVLQFMVATLLPVVASVALTRFSRRPFVSEAPAWQQQALYGFVFGLIAVFGTEFGIDTNDATMNVRDAAPLVAGLYFGSPAGIIAGLIGGIERWFSVLWGRGMFTRVACSVATVAVGFYAAALNRLIFEDRKPTWPMALAIGVVAEVLHLLLVFVTNLDDAVHAFEVVRACTAPMISCTGISVALSGAAIAKSHGVKLLRRAETREISQVIQAGLLGVVVVGLLATVGFSFSLQQASSMAATRTTLTNHIEDVRNDVRDASDDNLLGLTREVAARVPSVDEAKRCDLVSLAREIDVNEIHYIDGRGIIVASSVEDLIGFDMASGEQSAEFLCLIDDRGANEVVQDYRPMTAYADEWRKYAGIKVRGGFMQVGYDASRFLDEISNQVRSAVRNRHVGEEGFFVVIGQDGSVKGMRADRDVSDLNVMLLRQAMAEVVEGEMFTADVHGERHYAMYADVEGFRIVAMIPASEAVLSRDLSVLVAAFMEVIVFAALFAAVYVLIKNVVVGSIWQVNGTLNKITSGDLEAQVNVRDSIEFASLSDDINRTVAALRAAIDAESARIEQDLATAKAIQKSALPQTFPPFPDVHVLDIYASMNAAREVGGDFYDFFPIGSHTIGFLIADVSGKGIPASLFMMAAKSELANHMKSGMNLAEAVRAANRNLCDGNDAGMFVTVWAAVLDYESGELTYVNAGHNPPLLRHGGTWTWLKNRGGLFLGTFAEAKYRSETIELRQGDEILLYTDGVNEAFSVDEEEFGNDRLEAFLASNADLRPHQLIDSLGAEVRAWATGAEQSDDITMVCVEYGVEPEVSGNVEVPATKEGLSEVRQRMHFKLSHLRCPEEVQLQIDLVIEELFVNICQHGYATEDGQETIMVSYLYDTDPARVTISMVDWGVPFDPLSYAESSQERQDDMRGMGIALVRGTVDDISYVRDGDRNVVAFVCSW